MSQHLVYHFKISLLGAYPLIWRRFKVDSKTPLSKFHTIIQCFMGWEHFHLYKFEYKWQCFEYDGNCSPLTTLEELNMVKGASLNYSYDFGDVRHEVAQILVVAKQQPQILLCESTRRCA